MDSAAILPGLLIDDRTSPESHACMTHAMNSNGLLAAPLGCRLHLKGHPKIEKGAHPVMVLVAIKYWYMTQAVDPKNKPT